MQQSDGRPPLVSLALASASALAYQLLLIRLFSIIQWHHFAYMIISLALLGYGASGTFLSLAGGRLERWRVPAYISSIALFAAAGLPAFLLAQQIAFNPEELLWRPSLSWRLAGLYVVLGIPFFFVACAIGMALMRWGRQASRVYAVDLAGAAAGGVLAVTALFFLEPIRCLQAATLLGATSAFVAAMETGRWRGPTGLFVAGMLAIAVVTPRPGLKLSPYKDLSAALQVAGARVELVHSSPYGQVAVVSNRTVPFREAPGMGLTAGTEPPEQLALFVDGDLASVVTRNSGEEGALDFLGSLPSAAPFALGRPERVLVLRAGGGLLALQARALGAREVVAVERNPDVIEVVSDTYSAFSGELYDGESVRAIRAHPRSFLGADEGGWDLIQVPGAGGLGAGASGLFALSEDYLHTREAAELLLERLAPGGVAAVSVWLSLPPRASLRLVATLVEALRAEGVEAPGRNLVVLRSWQMATVLVRNGPFVAADYEALRHFASEKGFDLVWYSGQSRDQSGRVHRMAQPWLYDAVKAFVEGKAQEFFDAYKFDIRPTSDDRPFFNNFVRWQTVPETLGLLRSGGMPLLEAGYVLLLATLLQAIMLAAALILAPLLVSGARRTLVRNRGRSARTLIYFSSIGLAFMLIELAAIHRFILFLEEPVFASAVVVAAFLVFAGLGSLASGRAGSRSDSPRLARTGALGVVVLLAGWLALLGAVTEMAGAMSMPAKILVALAFIGPLAFSMGHLFPTGVSALSRHDPGLVPWAWAVNGCASVIGAVLATVLAMAAGFNGCLLTALGLYVATLFSFPVHDGPRQQVR